MTCLGVDEGHNRSLNLARMIAISGATTSIVQMFIWKAVSACCGPTLSPINYWGAAIATPTCVLVCVLSAKCNMLCSVNHANLRPHYPISPSPLSSHSVPALLASSSKSSTTCLWPPCMEALLATLFEASITSGPAPYTSVYQFCVTLISTLE